MPELLWVPARGGAWVVDEATGWCLWVEGWMR